MGAWPACGLLAMVLAGTAVAQERGPPMACVDVEVDGQRVEDYACLSRMLAPATTPAAPLPQLEADAVGRRAPTALGLAHRETTRQRMGNTFGKSTLPQRPAPPVTSLPPALHKP